MSDWRISRKGTACSFCARSFAPEETIVSAIFELEPGGDEGPGTFERVDACPGCFGEEGREPFSRWLARLPPPAPARPVLDLSLAGDFLLRLAREGEPARRNLLYILTLLLLRKRKVKLVEQRVEEEGPVMEILLRGEAREETVLVPVVEPSEEETREIETELGRLFGLPGGPAA